MKKSCARSLLRIVAQVVLDKLPNLKTVVNKLHEIDSVYRNFDLEILGGEPNTIVCCRESKATFQFDFAKVYWNPRLSTYSRFSFVCLVSIVQAPNASVSRRSCIPVTSFSTSLPAWDRSLCPLRCWAVLCMPTISILSVSNGCRLT